MLNDLLLAYKNVVRHRRRSAFALAAVAFGVVALMLASGFIEWNFRYYRESMIETQFGHLRVQRKGYAEHGQAEPRAWLLPETTPDRDAIASLPGVRVLSPRLAVSGLASHGEVTLPFVADGVDPGPRSPLAGSAALVAGRGLSADDPAGVILGRGLAAHLGVKPGDSLVLVATVAGGGINAVDATVRGVFASVSKAYDDVALRLPLATAQTLMRIQGSHHWMVWLDDTRHTPRALAAVERMLAGRPYEVVPWWHLSDFYNKSAALFDKQVAVMKVIIGVLIVLSISNTMTMGVLERTGEIGTAMALGDTRARILRRFVAEALVVAVVGSLLGTLVGAGLAALVTAIGIPVPPPPGMGHGYTGGILVSFDIASGAILLAVGTTLVASCYPAWKASRLEIVDALRYNRA